jgi:hypothetical protein
VVETLYQEATRARNPGRTLPTLRIAQCTVRAPGVVELRFAYGTGREKVVMPPTVARLYWAA